MAAFSYPLSAPKHPFGITEPLPPKGFPDGRLRWCIRNDDFVLARVKTSDGIREFYVKEENGHWMPSFEKGRNATVNSGDDKLEIKG
jgi:hypothetical protein